MASARLGGKRLLLPRIVEANLSRRPTNNLRFIAMRLSQIGARSIDVRRHRGRVSGVRNSPQLEVGPT